ncbi:hypothetical protein [Haloarcula sp. CGMCC 1.6347]|uniref:hypothetical protein n=1 Tax=Haloarcula sp. CGMCC 1.6347 TaxID=3111455 RepID=UPI00300EAD35
MSGVGPRPESGCNCIHLPPSSKCVECRKQTTGLDVQVVADGGRDDWHSCDDCGAQYRDEDAADACCAASILRGFLP